MSIVNASPASVDPNEKSLRKHLSLADRGFAVSIYLALKLQGLQFLEGEVRVWETEVAKVLASTFDAFFDAANVTHHLLPELRQQ